MDKINPFRHKPSTVVRPLLNALFPAASRPLIISAPMLGVSTGRLAAAVSSAGGLGFVAGGADLSPGSAQLRSLSSELATARSALGLADYPLTPAPVGVGFILCHPSASRFEEAALPLLIEHSPQAVWLFAPGPDPEGGEALQAGIVAALKHAGFTVFVQVGTVDAARRAARDGADVIVAQGVDAGGHQYARGAGVVSLVPEVRTMLDEEFAGREIALVAAGGIVDGRGVAAALALGECGGLRMDVLGEWLTGDRCRGSCYGHEGRLCPWLLRVILQNQQHADCGLVCRVSRVPSARIPAEGDPWGRGWRCLDGQVSDDRRALTYSRRYCQC